MLNEMRNAARRRLPRAWPTVLLLTVILLIVVAVSTAQQAAQPHIPTTINSWIQGMITVGPPCPSAAAGAAVPTCVSKPLAGAIIEQRFGQSGVIDRTTSQDDGSYEFVEPGGGTYTIVGEAVPGISGTPAPVMITVAAGSGAHLDLRCTTTNH